MSRFREAMESARFLKLHRTIESRLTFRNAHVRGIQMLVDVARLDD